MIGNAFEKKSCKQGEIILPKVGERLLKGVTQMSDQLNVVVLFCFGIPSLP